MFFTRTPTSMEHHTLVPLNPVVVLESPFTKPANPTRTRVHFDMDPKLGNFYMDSIHHKYFGIGETFAKFNYDVLIQPEVEQHRQQYGLAIMGSADTSVKFHNRDWLNVKSGQSYITYNPGVEESHRLYANKPFRVHYLDLNAEYVTNLLESLEPEKGSQLYNFRKNALNNTFDGAGVDITNKGLLYQTLSAIFSCELTGTLRDIMLEGLLQQVLAIEFSLIGNSTPKQSDISPRDKDAMHAVKDYLKANLHGDHSLMDLAKRFGVNQHKLKIQFREMFGMPVISYLFDLKMQHAQTLLVDHGMYVGEVASVVGYRNANHFATAFKRKFGINPSKLKR